MKHAAILTMTLLLGLTLGAHAAEDTDDGSTGIPVDTPDGIVILDEHEQRFECIEESTLDQVQGGSLSPTNSCEHGIFVRTGFSMVHGFSGLPYEDNEWSGFMQSWLKWAGQNRGFECEFQEGELVECNAIGGVFPSQGERFIQECLAFDPHGLQLEVAMTEFGCMVTGEIELE